MILQIDDWKFDIDMAATMEYSSVELAEHCDCAYCRNFYATVDVTFPKLRPFLALFGVEIQAPEELMPFDLPDGMSYDASYAVAGRILSRGKGLLFLDGIYIAPEVDPQIEHSKLYPCFYLTIDDLVLPWVLDESMEEVVSPANFPAFLKRMWDKLLRKQPKSQQKS